MGRAPGLSFVKPEVTPGEPLKLEILSFLDSVRTRRDRKVTARQGRAALELALTIQAQMAAHAERAGLADFFKRRLGSVLGGALTATSGGRAGSTLQYSAPKVRWSVGSS